MGSKAQTTNGPDCPLAARRCIRKVQERPSLCFSRPRTDFGQARRNAPMQPDHARFGPEGHGRTPSLKEEKGKTRLLQSRCVRSPTAKPSAGHSIKIYDSIAKDVLQKFFKTAERGPEFMTKYVPDNEIAEELIKS